VGSIETGVDWLVGSMEMSLYTFWRMLATGGGDTLGRCVDSSIRHARLTPWMREKNKSVKMKRSFGSRKGKSYDFLHLDGGGAIRGRASIREYFCERENGVYLLFRSWMSSRLVWL